jgi:hypothetical protein
MEVQEVAPLYLTTDIFSPFVREPLKNFQIKYLTGTGIEVAISLTA